MQKGDINPIQAKFSYISDLLSSNVAHFLGLKRLDKQYPLKFEALEKLQQSEKIFFNLFHGISTGKRYWKKENGTTLFNELLNLIRQNIGIHEDITLKSRGCEYEFLPYAEALIILLNGTDKLPNSITYKSSLPTIKLSAADFREEVYNILDLSIKTIDNLFFEIALELIESEELFIKVKDSEKFNDLLKSVQQYAPDVTEIRFINTCIGKSKTDKSNAFTQNLLKLKQLGLKVPHDILKNSKSIFREFLEILPQDIEFKIGNEGSHYNPLLNTVTIDTADYITRWHSVIQIPNVEIDNSGQYTFSLKEDEIDLAIAHNYFHEGNHAINQPILTILNILWSRDNFSRVASLAFTTNIFGKNAKAEEGEFLSGIANYFAKNKTPQSKEAIDKFLAYRKAISKQIMNFNQTSAQSLMFFSNLSEILQMIGFIIVHDKLIINTRNDINFFVELNLPIITDHLEFPTVAIQNMIRDQSDHTKLQAQVIECVNSKINFDIFLQNLRHNFRHFLLFKNLTLTKNSADFLDLLLKILGKDSNEYKEKIRLRFLNI